MRFTGTSSALDSVLADKASVSSSSRRISRMPFLGGIVFSVHHGLLGENPRSIAYAGRMVDALSVVHSDPEISGGMPVFRGTRVPVQALFDYLEGGETLDQFLDQFPSVSKQQALAALDLARNSVLARARSA